MFNSVWFITVQIPGAIPVGSEGYEISSITIYRLTKLRRPLA